MAHLEDQPMQLNLQSAVQLLTGERRELFKFEKAITLLEFQTWIYWPFTNKADSAGMIAATLILHKTEEDISYEHLDLDDYDADSFDKPLKRQLTLRRIEELRKNRTYLAVHDLFFASRGGLLRLLKCPTPTKFDNDVIKRRNDSKFICDLVEYRLRHAQHVGNTGGGTINHAIFFKVWPTFEIPGKRGITVPGKSPSAKTLSRQWNKFRTSSIFIFLNDKYEFNHVPEIGGDAFDKLDSLSEAANDVEELRTFFGAYAYIAETIHNAGGEEPAVAVPTEVPRLEVETAPFTSSELRIISDYPANYMRMHYI
jgi:hypothetical protein